MNDNADTFRGDNPPEPPDGHTPKGHKTCPGSIVAAAAEAYRLTVQELREHGESPIQFLLMKYDPASESAQRLTTVLGVPESVPEKEKTAREIRHLIRAHGANCLVMVSDVWLAPTESVGPPREHPNRREAIFVQIEVEDLGRWCCTRQYTRIARQVFVESEMPALEDHSKADPRGRFVFFDLGCRPEPPS
jgi:hypothetical protein